MVLCPNSAVGSSPQAPSLPCLKNGYAKGMENEVHPLFRDPVHGQLSLSVVSAALVTGNGEGIWRASQGRSRIMENSSPSLCTQAGFRVSEDRPGEELRSCLFALCAGFCFLDLTSCCFPERPRSQDRIHSHHPSASMEASPRSSPRARQCPSELAPSAYHLSGNTSCSAPSHAPTHRQEAQVVCAICHLPAQVLTPTLDLHLGPVLPFRLCTWHSLHLPL